MGWDGGLQWPDRSPAELARGSRLRRQECCLYRLGCHRGDAYSGDRARMWPCHDAAALADLFQDGPQCDRDRRRVARAGYRRDMDPRDRAQENPAQSSVFTDRSFTEPEAVKQELLAAVRAHLGPDYDIETHFT